MNAPANHLLPLDGRLEVAKRLPKLARHASVWLRYVVEIRPERTVEGKFLGMGIHRSSKTNHGSLSSQPAQTCGGAIDNTHKPALLHEPRSSRREEAQTSFLVIQMKPRARGRRDNLTIQSSTVLGAGEPHSNKPSPNRHP